MTRKMMTLYLPAVAGIISLFCLPALSAAEYTINKDGTVSDSFTGLTWQRVDNNKAADWQSAMEYCQNLSLAGYDDWRLPNKYVLDSIRTSGDSLPAINQEVFPNTKARKYWTWTKLPYYDQLSFYVDFGNDTSIKTTDDRLVAMQWKNEYFYRCVRGKRKRPKRK